MAWRGRVIVALGIVAALTVATLAVAFALRSRASETPVSREELRALGFGTLPPVTLAERHPLWDSDKLSKMVELGKLLFFDPRLSGNGATSCATCHIPERGWTDGLELAVSSSDGQGATSTLHWRNTQTVINAANLQKLDWAGEAAGLEAQARSAIVGSLAGNLDAALAEERLRQIPGYVRLFKEVFGTDKPGFDDALRALAAFQATITSRNVPFDLYMLGRNDVLSDSAARGLKLFIGKARCSRCHSGPLFTDESFHNLGVPPNPQFETDPLRQISLRYQHWARGVSEDVYRAADRDLGLYYSTKQETDKGRFRTAPLRELGQTGPYMHNGVFKTLEEVVQFYNRGGGDDPAKDKELAPLGLSRQEVADLVAFLQALTGDPITVALPPLPDYEVSQQKGSEE